MGHQKLPPGHCIENGQVVHHWSDKEGNHVEVIANGTIEVRSVRQYTDHPNELFLVARFTNSNRPRYEDVTIPVKEISGMGKKLLNYIPDWFSLMISSPTKRLRFLQQILNLQRVEIDEVVKVLRVGPGYHFSENGSLFYVLGDVIISPPPGANIETTSPFHLRNEEGTPGQGVSWILKFCEQGPPQAALFVAALTAYIRPILEATNCFDRFCAFVVGESGVGKTENAKLLCQLFKEESGATLSSDKTGILSEMSLYRDLPFLVDDLNNCRITSAMNKKSERLSEILQQVSSSGILTIRGETFDVGHLTPVVTAESLIKSYSTINRTLIIAFEKPFLPETMTWLQEQRNLYVEFLKNFIKWACQNHTRLETAVRSWKFDNLDNGRNPNAYVGFSRLKRTFKILKIALELFLLHLHEVYAIPPEDEMSWRRLLEEGINQAVFLDTLKQLRRENAEQERFFVDAILDIFDGEKQICKAKNWLVAKSFEQYVKLNKQASIDGHIPKKIFFLSSDGYYYRFRGDDLVEYLINQYGSECKASKKAFSAQLSKYGLLQQYGGEWSYRPVEDIDHRYYALRRSVVEDMQRERLEEFQAALNKAMIEDSSVDYDMSRFIR